MTTTAARPRFLTIAITLLLILQVALLIQQALEASARATPPLWLVAVNGSTGVALLSAMLLSPGYPRASWLLLAVGIACLAISFVARSQLGA